MPNWKKLAAGGASASVILAALTFFFEGNYLTPYRDPGPAATWTNCEGNTHNVDPMKVMTAQECQVINGENQLSAMDALNKYVHVTITEAERGAYSDFIFNMGSSRFVHSTMLTYLNEGKHKEACAQLLRWTYAGGKQLPGLIKRREAEYEICMEGVTNGTSR